MNDKDFWIQVRRGLMLVVTAIEHRWSLPRDSTTTLTGARPGAPRSVSEPPLTAPARSHEEIEPHGIQRW